MNPDVVLSLGREAIEVTLWVAGPLLGVGLVAGVGVSLFQAVTQIQEPSLQFLPKLVAVLLVLGTGGAWLLNRLLAYTVGLLSNLNAYVS